jgi:hypothetical protein
MNRLGSALLTLAHWLMPRQRREWLEAMRAETAHLPAHAATAWAAGALVTAIKQRFMPMNTGDFRVARWVVLVETLGAFGFLTLGWFEVTFGASGLIHHDWQSIEKHYLTVQGGGYIVIMWLAGAVIWLVGPIGLYLGLRYVVWGRGLRNRAFGCSLVAIQSVFAIAGGVAGYLVGPVEFRVDPGMTLLFTLLPIAVILHLMYLGRTTPDTPMLVARA